MSDELERFNTRVPYYLWAVIGSIFAVAVLINISAYFSSVRRRRRAAFGPPIICTNPKYCTRHVPAACLAVWRKATITRSRLAEALGLGSLAQVLLISAYVGANLVLMAVHTGNTLNYTAHHAARLVVGNLPLVIGLATKNNVISYCTGFSYASLNALHRWAARLTLLLTIVHVAGRSIVNQPPVNPSLTGNGYVRWGIVAFIASGWMIICASRPIRNKFYQFFILQHVICFFLYLIALWVHRPKIYPFLVASLIIYSLDRIARTSRIIYRYSFRSFVHLGDAKNTTVQVFPGNGAGELDTMRVTVRMKEDKKGRARMRWRVGQHVYFHVPFLHAGGHPFSIASISESCLSTSSIRVLDEERGGAEVEQSEMGGEVVLLIRVREGMTKRLRDYAVESQSRSQSHPGSSLPSPRTTPSHTPVPDVEASLPSYPPNASPLLQLPQIYAWAEGAYGNLQHLDDSETLLLFAGGSGVSFTLPIMMDIVRRCALFERTRELGLEGEGEKKTIKGMKTNEVVATKKLVFVWTIKHDEHIAWISDELRHTMNMAPPSLDLSIHVYITRGPSGSHNSPSHITHPNKEHLALATSDSISANISSPSLPSCSVPTPQSITNKPKPLENQHILPPPSAVQIQIHRSRPSIHSIISTAILATPTQHHVAIGACGPQAMTRDVSEAVRREIKPLDVIRGERRRMVRLLVEEYGW